MPTSFAPRLAAFALLLAACRPSPAPDIAPDPAATALVTPGAQRKDPTAPEDSSEDPEDPKGIPFAVSKEQARAIVEKLSSVVEMIPVKPRSKLRVEVKVTQEATVYRNAAGRFLGELPCPGPNPRDSYHEISAQLFDGKQLQRQQSYLVNPYSGEVEVEPGEPYTEKRLPHEEWRALEKKLSQRESTVFTLPELQAFGRYLERASKGAVHLTVRPEQIPPAECPPGQECAWQFYVGESHTTHTVRWITIQIDEPTGALSVLEADGTRTPYEQWRKTSPYR